MGIATEVLEHGFGSGERWFDMDVPVEVAQGFEVSGEGLVIGELLMVSEEVEAKLVGVPDVQLIDQQCSETVARALCEATGIRGGRGPSESRRGI